MRNQPANAHQDTPRTVLAIGSDYPDALELATHRHRRAQLTYAAEGVVTVTTAQGAWVAPPERAVWIPAGVDHAVTMVGAVAMRSVWIEPAACEARGDACQVLAVSTLLRALLLTAVDLPAEYDETGRDGKVMDLLLAEVIAAPVVSLALPFPTTPALAGLCRRFLAQPNAHETIDEWSAVAGLGRRAFTRAFRRETGLSLAAWRQRACLMAALPRLAGGEPVTVVALDLGYDSPAAFATMFKRLIGIPPSRYQP